MESTNRVMAHPIPAATVFTEAQAIRALQALAQRQRLRAFRALVVAGPEGMTPGALAESLSLAPSGLSFHLKELTHAGLVDVEPRGRHLIYRSRYSEMNALIAYLTEHCCQGQPCTLDAAQDCTGC